MPVDIAKHRNDLKTALHNVVASYHEAYTEDDPDPAAFDELREAVNQADALLLSIAQDEAAALTAAVIQTITGQ